MSLWQRLQHNISYCLDGVWSDTRSLWSVKTVKVINLSVRAFMDRDLQIRAGSLTYSTVLAVVPALAMLFAIARGFGFQNLLQSELFRYFPAQRQALETALTYVENYLSQASQGIFIGIGLIFLLWTLLSLMSNVEDTFNHVWQVDTKRTLARKFTDYTALLLLIPVLMVCSAGISIFMSDAVQHLFEGNTISPVLHYLLAFMPIVISWLVFTAAYYIVPNTKVRLKGAIFAGVLCGTLFHVIQWLFVTGQLYVSKYNAIYGSFAFLPLMLVWMQLSWLITLLGVVLTYAWQNFDTFAYKDRVRDVAQNYSNNMAIAVLTLAVKRFKTRQQPLTLSELVNDYDIPGPLAEKVLQRLQRAGLLTEIASGKDQPNGYQPAYDPDDFTVNMVSETLANLGNANFIDKADGRFADVIAKVNAMRQQQAAVADIKLLDLI